MGCVVNGPGEARDADLGIAAGPRQGPPVRARDTSCAWSPRPTWSRRWSTKPRRSSPRASRPGIAAADENAEAIAAAATREELIQIQGFDANHSEDRIDRIREIAEQ